MRPKNALTEEQERELIQKVKNNNKEAKLILIEANLNLVSWVIMRYYLKCLDHGITWHDLTQEGRIGLCEAVEKFNPEFNPEKDTKLSTYAISWIRQRIGKAVRRMTKIIRISSHLTLKRIDLIKEFVDDFIEKNDCQPTLEEIAQGTEIKLKEVKLLYPPPRTISLETPLGENDRWNPGTISEFIPDEKTTNPEELILGKSRNEKTAKILNYLSPRERKVVEMRFGLGKETDHTLQEIGQDFEVTRERIRQIEARALRKLKPHAKEELKDFIE